MKFDSTALADGAVSFFGHYDFDFRKMGISPRRLPDWTRPQLPDLMDVMIRMPSGVRLAFETDASTINLKVQTTRMVTPPNSPRAVVFDLQIKSKLMGSFSSHQGNTILIDPNNNQNYTMEKGSAYTVNFSNLGDQLKQCEIWLPHNAFVEIRHLDCVEATTVKPIPEPSSKRWIHYGSSISHCMEADQPTGTWPVVASHINGMHLRNLGVGGQCHLDQFVARTIRDSDTDLITIKTGINIINMDSMRERVFIPALHGFLDTIREGRHANTPIVLISPIYCPSAESNPGPTIPNASGKFITLRGHEEIQTGCLTLGRVREIIEKVVRNRQKTGDTHIHYLNGLTLFGQEDAADLPDDLHPNPNGYRRMGKRFSDAISNFEFG